VLAQKTIMEINPIQWLEEKIPGFRQLNEEERLAIQHFALLWSLFEGKALGAQASAPKILSVVHNGFARHVMELTPYQKCFDYFRARYFSNGTLTHQFDQLRVSSADRPLVEQVLREENNNPADIVAVILIVIYRFRNNLFHGVKWEYELRDQLDNFNHANQVLMVAYDQLLNR